MCLFWKGMTEPEVLDALDQFHAKHLILFEDMNAPGVKDAFNSFSASGQANLHTAKITGSDKPGLFEFTSSQDANFASAEDPLVNPENGHCVSFQSCSVHYLLAISYKIISY